ncbi:alpha/beta-hydrolase [Pseudoneurospora amorphoporcata]|uniref:Alpha/beta-hydrolase n=1 Tax=Pseudoneurospora amorphoporcata TaxID=241081 RepID=A0AAN6SKX9_9PEZI|nr:alpha/beta-hydrolase [Pseudoneurospora amorphoporcata]
MMMLRTAFGGMISNLIGRIVPPPRDHDGGMILGAVSYLDCIVFCIFLAPQLIWNVGLVPTIKCLLEALPFVLFKLPMQFIYERWLISCDKRPPFVRNASPFEDFVIRCVRYAFANIPPNIGRVFFSKQVALPFLRFRMLRHGYLRSPVHWRERNTPAFRGIWVMKDPLETPDFVLYYAHGGGFSMGSAYFYLEFLLTWLSVLSSSGFENPAIFALDYTLVPDASYPTQIQETIEGYRYVLKVARDPAIVCVSGDSAGATLILSLLLHLSCKDPRAKRYGVGLPMPGQAVLISPWTTLVSPRHTNTTSDYLDAEQLSRYGRQFSGSKISWSDPLVSPGCCHDATWWRRASPSNGIFIAYGEEEVFAPEIHDLVARLTQAGLRVASEVEPGGIHAWPVASLFLSTAREKRLKGVNDLTTEIRKRLYGCDAAKTVKA